MTIGKRLGCVGIISALLAALSVPAKDAGSSSGPRFRDVTAASGIVLGKDAKAHAVAIEDFDGDGLFDIVISTFDPPHIYYFKNLGNLRFKDMTKGSGLEGFDGCGTGIAVGDFDRDGKLDIYLTSLRGGPSRLFKGNGDGTFTDVSKQSGTLLTTPARSCAWTDFDGDGWLDLYVTSPDGANHLFRNNRDGTFTDVAEKAGVALKGKHSLGCAFGDVDGDGLDDLFVTNYDSQVSALFRNLGNGKFEDITEKAGLARKASAVGCVFADVFNRGRLDLYVTTDSWLSGANYTEDQLLKMNKTVEPSALYANDGKGNFTLVDAPLLKHKTLSHDALLEDLDHDGLIDIYVGVDAESGNKWATSKGGNPLWTRPDGKAWTEASKAWGLDHEANCVCVPAADLDNDGDLDVLLVNFYSNVVLYRNETNDKNWLRVKAVGTKSNLDGIGAQVSVFTEEKGEKKLVGFRHIQSGAGYARCSPLEAHFGLGKNAAASYRVEVFFPATKKRVVRDKVSPGQRIVVKEE
jgi:hypothetical protein